MARLRGVSCLSQSLASLNSETCFLSFSTVVFGSMIESRNDRMVHRFSLLQSRTTGCRFGACAIAGVHVSFFLSDDRRLMPWVDHSHSSQASRRCGGDRERVSRADWSRRDALG